MTPPDTAAPPEPASGSPLSGQPALAATVVAVATGLLLLPRLWEPLGRDQSVFCLVARLWWSGQWPYRDVFEHKPPGLLAAYALVTPLGDLGPAALDLGAAALTSALLVRLLWPLGRAPAVLAGLLYAVAARHPVFGGFWDIAQPEPLQECAVALAAWSAVRHRWGATGVALFCALALKFTLILAVPVAVVAAWPNRRALGRLGLGLLVPAALLAGVLAAVGALEPAWRVGLLFNLHHASATSLPWDAVPAVAVGSFGRLAKGFAGVPLLMLYALVAEAMAPSPRRKVVLFAVLAWLAGIAQALVQAKLWAWHWQAAVLPMVFLAGVGLSRLPRPAHIALGLAALLTALPGWGAYWSEHSLAQLATGEIGRPQFLQTYRWGRRDWSAIEVQAAAGWLHQHAKPEDRLLVWGFEPGLYWHSQLVPASRWIYDYPLTVALPAEQRAAGIAELAATLPKTRWWVVMGSDRNALESEPSDVQLRRFPTLADALDRDYRPVQRIGDAQIYERITR